MVLRYERVFIFIFLFVFVSPLTFALICDPTIQGGCPTTKTGITNINTSYTIINNTFINQTVNATVNTTQFDSNSPIHIKESWLTSFITAITNGYCKLTGCTMTGNITFTNAAGINNPNYIQFNTTNVPLADPEGLLQWNPTDGTLDLGMEGGEITMQIGQELFAKVRNEAGYENISNGQVVYISGRTGVFPDVRKARSDNESTSRVLGVATQDLLSPSFGYITTFGYVRGIKTDYTGNGIWGTTWETGDMLYVSKTDAGVLTNVEPAEPHHSDIVGEVGVVSATQGSILVLNQKHTTMEELTDVDGTPLTTSGQFPVWNQTAGYFDFDYNINSYAKKDGTDMNSIYGEVYGKNDTGFYTIDLVTVDTYVSVDNLTNGSINGFTWNAWNLTAQYAGVYKATAKFGIENKGTGGDNGMKIFINSVGQNNCYDHEHTSSTQPIGFIVDCIIRLNVGDNVSVRFDDHQSPVTDLLALNGNLNLLRIGN